METNTARIPGDRRNTFVTTGKRTEWLPGGAVEHMLLQASPASVPSMIPVKGPPMEDGNSQNLG